MTAFSSRPVMAAFKSSNLWCALPMNERRALRASATTRSQKPGPIQQDLVSCARCGMHLPRAEAREAGGRLYCGEEHARLGAG